MKKWNSTKQIIRFDSYLDGKFIKSRNRKQFIYLDDRNEMVVRWEDEYRRLSPKVGFVVEIHAATICLSTANDVLNSIFGKLGITQ